jgi:hypothetical protein
VKTNTAKQRKRIQKDQNKRQRLRPIDFSGVGTGWGEQIILIASDLKLVDVPEHAREGVRSFLAPFLTRIPIMGGECSVAARLLVQTANSHRVQYVEGVWSNRRMPAPVRHAWNVVDGHIVDLSMEYKLALIDRWCAREGKEWPDELPHWQRTPSKVYTLQEIDRWSQVARSTA